MDFYPLKKSIVFNLIGKGIRHYHFDLSGPLGAFFAVWPLINAASNLHTEAIRDGWITSAMIRIVLERRATPYEQPNGGKRRKSWRVNEGFLQKFQFSKCCRCCDSRAKAWLIHALQLRLPL